MRHLERIVPRLDGGTCRFEYFADFGMSFLDLIEHAEGTVARGGGTNDKFAAPLRRRLPAAVGCGQNCQLHFQWRERRAAQVFYHKVDAVDLVKRICLIWLEYRFKAEVQGVSRQRTAAEQLPDGDLRGTNRKLAVLLAKRHIKRRKLLRHHIVCHRGWKTGIETILAPMLLRASVGMHDAIQSGFMRHGQHLLSRKSRSDIDVNI